MPDLLPRPPYNPDHRDGKTFRKMNWPKMIIGVLLLAICIYAICSGRVKLDPFFPYHTQDGDTSQRFRSLAVLSALLCRAGHRRFGSPLHLGRLHREAGAHLEWTHTNESCMLNQRHSCRHRLRDGKCDSRAPGSL
jgi:hypothetical protein